MKVWPIISYFRQVDHLLVVKTFLKNDLESHGILFSEVYRLECIRHISSDEDYSCGFVGFLHLIFQLNGSSQLLGSQVELYILCLLQVVSFKDLQSSEICLIESWQSR